MNNILRIVSELQQSLYPEHLTVTPQCAQYLGSIRYIDELQKFIEDDQWKKSLALEPVETSGDVASSAASKFIPGHRKTRSEGGSLFFTCGRGLGLAAAS